MTMLDSRRPAPARLRPGSIAGPPLEMTVADDAALAARPRQSADFHRVRRGVYVPAAGWAQLTPWQRYLVRVHAVALLRPNAVFCLESAGALLGLPTFGEPRDVHVFDVGAPRSHRIGDVLRHTSTVTPEIIVRDGVRLTAAAETVAGLARGLPPAFGLAVADAAIAARRGSMTTVDAIERASARAVDTRGIRRLRWILENADPAAESWGESVSRAVIQWLGFADPELQHAFRFEGSTDRVDFWWPGARVAGESDGWGKYDLAQPAAARAALVAEKRREDRLRRHGIRFARWDWADALGFRPLERALTQAGVPRPRPPQHAMLATLRSNPRSLPHG